MDRRLRELERRGDYRGLARWYARMGEHRKAYKIMIKALEGTPELKEWLPCIEAGDYVLYSNPRARAVFTRKDKLAGQRVPHYCAGDVFWSNDYRAGIKIITPKDCRGHLFYTNHTNLSHVDPWLKVQDDQEVMLKLQEYTPQRGDTVNWKGHIGRVIWCGHDPRSPGLTVKLRTLYGRVYHYAPAHECRPFSP